MPGTVLLRAIHAAYRASLTLARRRFDRAARGCESAQAARLRRLVAANTNSQYGRAHGFDRVFSVRDWQNRVPVVGYDELEPWVQRASCGERNVLTAEPVRVFERTSGSTAPNKLVPYTNTLLAEFAAATGPWLHDLYTSLPALRGASGYWSISPAMRGPERTPGGVPIGFADDTQYFGSLARMALRRTLAVPPAVARLQDMEAWSMATARHLVASANLGLVSIWHPSFFTLLLRTIEARLDELLGGLTPRRAADVRARLGRYALGEALWPRLALVSCWADGASADALPALRRYVPHARVQPKGLLATEGVVSFPLLHGDESHEVAAVAGHFLEFVDLEHPKSRLRLAHELRSGASYGPVVSTGGGFYRYRFGDAVRCHGFYMQAPLLHFEGRIDQVCDVCGEKLNARLVAAALRRAEQDTAVSLSFALVTPVAGDPPRYRLYGEGTDDANLRAFGDRLDRALAENDSYRYARALGQLAAIEAVAVRDGAARYHRACVATGQRPGNIKPTYLDNRLDWSAVFGGVTAAPSELSEAAR